MKFDFRPHVPTKEDIEGLRSPEAMTLLQKRIGNLFSSWRALYEAPFEDITTNAAAHRLVEEDQLCGKIILDPTLGKLDNPAHLLM